MNADGRGAIGKASLRHGRNSAGSIYRPLGRPEEIASAVLLLGSPGASFVVDQPLSVEGGLTAH